MIFVKLKAEVDNKLRLALSAEGLMLVDFFMPFCEAQQTAIKKFEDKLAETSGSNSKSPSKHAFKPPKIRFLRQKSEKKLGGQQGQKGGKSPTMKLFRLLMNQAEKDPRMNKVLQKVFGGFRSLVIAKEFTDTRSFVAAAISGMRIV